MKRNDSRKLALIRVCRWALGSLEEDDQLTVSGVGEQVHRNGHHRSERQPLDTERGTSTEAESEEIRKQ